MTTGPINKATHTPIPTNLDGVKKNLAQYDTNHDGTVTREEFIKARADEMVASEIDEDQAAAKTFDALMAATPLTSLIPAIGQAGESLEFLGKAGFGGSFDAKADEGRYRDFDVNHDGKVDFNEFHAGKFRERVAADEFGRMDANWDNVLVVDNDARQDAKAAAQATEEPAAKTDAAPQADDQAGKTSERLKAIGDALTSLLADLRKDDASNKLVPILTDLMKVLDAFKPDEEPAKEPTQADQSPVSYDFDAAGTAARALKDVVDQDPSAPNQAEKADGVGWWGAGDKVADQFLLRKFPLEAERAVKEYYAKHQKLPTLTETVSLTKQFVDAGVDVASQQNVLNRL